MNVEEFMEGCGWDSEYAIDKLAHLLDEANAEIERLNTELDSHVGKGYC